MIGSSIRSSVAVRHVTTIFMQETYRNHVEHVVFNHFSSIFMGLRPNLCQIVHALRLDHFMSPSRCRLAIASYLRALRKGMPQEHLGFWPGL